MSNVRNVGDSTIAGCRYMLNDDDLKMAYGTHSHVNCNVNATINCT
jgi:hypothetical protein